jgi:hypothetical protein
MDSCDDDDCDEQLDDDDRCDEQLELSEEEHLGVEEQGGGKSGKGRPLVKVEAPSSNVGNGIEPTHFKEFVKEKVPEDDFTPMVLSEELHAKINEAIKSEHAKAREGERFGADDQGSQVELQRCLKSNHGRALFSEHRILVFERSPRATDRDSGSFNKYTFSGALDRLLKIDLSVGSHELKRRHLSPIEPSAGQIQSLKAALDKSTWPRDSEAVMDASTRLSVLLSNPDPTASGELHVFDEPTVKLVTTTSCIFFNSEITKIVTMYRHKEEYAAWDKRRRQLKAANLNAAKAKANAKAKASSDTKHGDKHGKAHDGKDGRHGGRHGDKHGKDGKHGGKHGDKHGWT